MKLTVQNQSNVEQNQASTSVFLTPQVKGKFLKKTRQTLLGTREQNISVLRELITEFDEDNETSDPVVTTGYQLSPDTTKKIQDFFLNDEISRASPNVRDAVTVVANKKKEKLSVKHMLFSMKEAYGMFCKEFPNVKVSISTFFKLRPINVLSFTKMPHNICCCQIHENVRCMLKALKNADMVFSNLSTDNSMHVNFVCSSPTDNCFENNCDECCNSLLLKKKAEALPDPSNVVSWYKWVKTDKNDAKNDQKTQYCNIEKVKKDGSIMKLLNELYDIIPEFLDHEFVKMNQASSSSLQIKKALESDTDRAVLGCDFAENFKCPQQNATQSANYGQSPITLFTVALYHRKLMPIVIASDSEKHGKESVLAYLDIIFSKCPSTIKVVDIWSDNATSQFKNQFVMEGMKNFESRYGFKIRWNFYAPMHGKAVVDGIGGNVKRFVRKRIIAQDLLVQTAAEFANVASSMDTEVIPISASELGKRNKDIGLQSIVQASKKIGEIKKNHFFESSVVNVGKRMIQKIMGQKITPRV